MRLDKAYARTYFASVDQGEWPIARQTQFRFPGRVEVRYPDARPELGEIVSSQRKTWVVIAVEAEDEDRIVCMLAPAEQEPEEEMAIRAV